MSLIQKHCENTGLEDTNIQVNETDCQPEDLENIHTEILKEAFNELETAEKLLRSL